MSDDPWAAYRAPATAAAPAAETPAAPSGGADPWAAYRAPGSSGAKAGAPASELDYSNSPWSARWRTLENAATLGAGDLIYAHMTGQPLEAVKAKTSAAESSLPWWQRLPIEGVGYGLGAGMLLNPIGEAAGAGAATMGAGKLLAGLAAGGTEGALAGGAHAIASTDNPTLGGVLGGTAGGALIGGAGGSIAPLVNKGLTKTMGTPASIDPATAIAATGASKSGLYGQLKTAAFDPNDMSSAYNVTLPDPSLKVSKSLKAVMDDHVDTIHNQGGNSAESAANYAQEMRRIANEPSASKGDTMTANQIADNLVGPQGVLATAKPITGQAPGDAYDLLKQANDANSQWEMAKNLAEWQRRAATGAPLGEKPLTEAETYYQGDPDKYQTLVDLYKKSQSQQDPSWALGHVAAGALGDLGGMMFGFPGHLGMEALAYLGLKPAIKNMFKGRKQNAMVNKLQQAYPQLTGQPLTGATTGPQAPPLVGQALKSLALGGLT